MNLLSVPRRSAPAPLIILLAAGCGTEPGPPETGDQRSVLDLPSANVVDLSHPFNAETVYWPTEEGFQRDVTADGPTEAGYHYSAGTFTSAEHGGTHIDAPIHFSEGAETVDAIPLERLMGPAVVVDIRERAADPDHQISVEDLDRWEAEHGPIPEGGIVLFRTGFGAFWPDRQRYMGTDARGAEAVADLHFPGLHPDAARWLLENRDVDAVGIDTPSIDHGQSQLFEAHRILAGENVPAFENVANLDRVPATGSVVIALPMKIEGGSGGPLRIVAFLP